MDVILFLAFAALAVVCAINVVVQSHPISSAVSLVGVMGSLAILYLLLGAEFIAAAQVIVYAGAIMVLFVFVIMLLNAGAESRRDKLFDKGAKKAPHPSAASAWTPSPRGRGEGRDEGLGLTFRFSSDAPRTPSRRASGSTAAY